jgi:hypothetical protein
MKGDAAPTTGRFSLSISIFPEFTLRPMPRGKAAIELCYCLLHTNGDKSREFSEKSKELFKDREHRTGRCRVTSLGGAGVLPGSSIELIGARNHGGSAVIALAERVCNRAFDIGPGVKVNLQASGPRIWYLPYLHPLDTPC